MGQEIERSGRGKKSFILREVESFGKEVHSGIKYALPELRNKLRQSSQGEILQAQDISEKARIKLQEEDPDSYAHFFGSESSPPRLVAFKKRGFHSQLFRFGNNLEHVMKVWGGGAATPALVDTSTRNGYEQYKQDMRMFEEIVGTVNDKTGGALSHFIVTPRASVWVADESNSHKGTMVEFLPMLKIIHSAKERKKAICEHPSLQEEFKAALMVHQRMLEKGVGMDLVDKNNLPIVMFPGEKPHVVAIDSGFEHSLERNLRLSTITFRTLELFTLLWIGWQLFRHTQRGRRGRSEGNK